MATDLQVHCHQFAAGRPALAFELNQLEAIVDAFASELAGSFPDEPHLLMSNVKLPVYGLAYSGFVRTLKINLTSSPLTLEAALTATVHPLGSPSKVIATYDVTLDRPLDVFPSYSQAGRELRWTSTTTPLANVSPQFSHDAEQILEALGLPIPALDTYERKVESAIVWNTANSFVQLVLNALPSIDLGEAAPWLTFLEPLQFDFGRRYLVITSNKMTLAIGNCSPVNTTIEADPSFPYGNPSPVESSESRAHVAVYFPRSRLLEFVSKNVMPAVMYDTGEQGGAIRWRMNGAFGLKEFFIDVAGGLQVGNPWSGDMTLRGTMSIATEIALTGVARAWVDGPCGTKVGLASASIQGDGAFNADVTMVYRSPGGLGASDYGATIEGELIVTKSELSPGIGIDAVGWPIDDLIGMLVNQLVTKEVHKLSGGAHKLGRWEVLAVPSWLVDLLGGECRLAPVVESLDNVSSVIGITNLRG